MVWSQDCSSSPPLAAPHLVSSSPGEKTWGLSSGLCFLMLPRVAGMAFLNRGKQQRSPGGDKGPKHWPDAGMVMRRKCRGTTMPPNLLLSSLYCTSQPTLVFGFWEFGRLRWQFQIPGLFLWMGTLPRREKAQRSLFSIGWSHAWAYAGVDLSVLK